LETLRIALVDLDARFGGGQIALGNMAYSLSKKGHEVHLLLGVKNIPERLIKLCSTNCYLHQKLGYSDLIHMRKNIEQISDYILKLHRTLRFDVINAQGINGILIPKSLQDRLVVTLHGNNLQRGLNLLNFSCKNSEIRQAIPGALKNFFKNLFGHFLYAKLEKKACENAKLVVTLTPTEAYYAKKYYSISGHKIRIVPNAIIDLNENRSELIRIPEPKKVILSVGALEFIKGTPILARAMRYVLASTENVIYVSVGDGPLMNYVRELRAEFPKKVIIFNKVFDGLSSIYARSSAFVQGSLYEALSLSMAEAMLAGKPVVAFGLASIPDLVVDNLTGYLAKPACSRDLAIKTLSLISNEEKMLEMGFNARKTVDKLCSVEVVGNSMQRIMKEV